MAILGLAREPEDGPFLGGELVECLGTEAADRLAAVPPRHTTPARAKRPTCQQTSGWESPTWAVSSATVAAPREAADDASRFTSAMALWKRRSWRRSSGWEAAAIVLRTRARVGTGRGTPLRGR